MLVGAGAKILGNFEIGSNSKIAAGAVVLRDIPENSTAVGIPAHVVKTNGEKLKKDGKPSEELDQVNVPDPVETELAELRSRLAALEETVRGKDSGR